MSANDDGLKTVYEVSIEAFTDLLARLCAAEVDAERYRWLIEQGDSTQWTNILKADPDDFKSLDECIARLMEQNK